MKIEAGAGTGKTTAIVEQLLLELMDKGADPHKILALTFTVKAAAEMRDRLRRRLRDLLDGKPIKELGGRTPAQFIHQRRDDAVVADAAGELSQMRVRMNIERDPSGLFVGQVSEYPGIITQGRIRAPVRRKLVRLLREISREHPEEPALFK